MRFSRPDPPTSIAPRRERKKEGALRIARSTSLHSNWLEDTTLSVLTAPAPNTVQLDTLELQGIVGPILLSPRAVNIPTVRCLILRSIWPADQQLLAFLEYATAVETLCIEGTKTAHFVLSVTISLKDDIRPLLPSLRELVIDAPAPDNSKMFDAEVLLKLSTLVIALEDTSRRLATIRVSPQLCETDRLQLATLVQLEMSNSPLF